MAIQAYQNVADTSSTAAQKLYTAIDLGGASHAAAHLKLEQTSVRFLSRDE